MEKKFDFWVLFSKLFQDIDNEKIMLSVENLKDEFPQLDNEQLSQKIIDEEALFCGVIGAATGALPWPWSILGVAPDLMTLITKQSRMVLSIAYVYGYEPDAKERAVEVLGCIGTSAGAVAGTYGIKKLVERKMQQELIAELARRIGALMMRRIGARFIPLIGAMAGGFFNFGSVMAVGNTAMNYYRNRETKAPESPAEDRGDFIEDVSAVEKSREAAGHEEQKPEEAQPEAGEPGESEESGGDEAAAEPVQVEEEDNGEEQVSEEESEEEQASDDSVNAGDEDEAAGDAGAPDEKGETGPKSEAGTRKRTQRKKKK